MAKSRNSKEYMREYMKMYRKNNKEKITKIVQNWRDKNQKHLKEYRDENKEKITKLVQNWREKEHSGTFKVYILPNAKFYVGYTKALKPRMYRHKQQGRDCSDYIVLHVCDTKEDALAYEKIYHDLGLPGGKKKK